ncbi:Crp/Fnr family transcriptional regulator [Nocardioides dilutus]
MDHVGVLHQTPIFRDLAVADLEELAPVVLERHYARGAAVWLEGDRADVLCVVAAGQLKAHRVSPDGREVILAVYGVGAVTGEVGLFHPAGLRWLALSAMTPSRCLMIRRAPLLAFLSRHPAAMQRMLESLSIAAVRAAYSYSGMAFEDIGRRVASLLLFLAQEYGDPDGAGARIRLRLSQGDLAAHVGASRENVNRALARLTAARVVSQHDGHLHVLDLAALEAVATGADV